MRTALPVLLVLALAALPAFADEPPTATEPPPAKPDPAKALFISESLMPGEKDVPAGWELEDDETAAGGPEEDQLIAIGEALGLDDDVFYVQMQSFAKGGAVVTAAMIDVDEKVHAFRHALTAKATESGWKVGDLGHPGRILVLGGPAGAAGELHEALKKHTIYALSEMAMNRLRGRAGHEDAGHAAARTYTGYIDSLAPDTGTANAVIGVMHWIQSRKDLEPKEKPRRDEEEKAIAHFGKALRDGVPYPPKGSVRVFAAGQMGGIILTWKDRSKLKDATRALEIAVEHEKDAKQMGQRHGNRYNLARAYARAGRVDDAFGMLEKSLEVLKTMPPQQWRASHKHIEEKDPDMQPLRSDPRFSKLMEDFRPPAPPKRKLPPGHPPVGGDDDGK